MYSLFQLGVRLQFAPRLQDAFALKYGLHFYQHCVIAILEY